ncbi:hypothetical protein F5Y15DRAFT_214781 [Xylariaceae sp. FL0016]|nr:hypothetical protein F5Y15DRAFT_214781 [Xylariaceae sp. FL0016]
MSQDRPRRHSSSSGDEESFHPHPARPKRDGKTRAFLPRSKSVSNVFDAAEQAARLDEDATRNMGQEQTDIGTLRELAKFLRTTGPPLQRSPVSQDCFGFSSPGENKKWTVQSLKKNKRPRSNGQSLQLRLPDRALPETSAEGYKYFAIATPIVGKSQDGGPWCRSQYPVFIPNATSPREHVPGAWPERTSSKGALGPQSTGDISKEMPNESAEPKNMASCKQPAVVPSGRYEHSLASSSPRAQDLSPTLTLKPVHEMDEIADEAALSTPDGSSAPHNSAIRSFMQREQQSSPVTSISEPSSPRSPRRMSKKPANINVPSTLAVPKETILPESPGFPNMLASMAFPSPPVSSRPSSQASSVNSLGNPPKPLTTYPTVLPRKSSRRACTSGATSAASLDEILMQKRPPLRQIQSAGPSQSASPSSRWVDTGVALDANPSKDIQSASNRTRKITRVSSTSSTQSKAEPHQDSGAPTICGDIDHHVSRQSSASRSYRDSTTTTSSNRQSTRSDMTMATETTAATLERPNSGALSRFDSKALKASQVEEGLDSRSNFDAAVPSNDATVTKAQRPRENADIEAGEQQVDSTRSCTPTSISTTASCDAESITSLSERRMARKAKTRESKKRDLDISRSGCLDSPVLGWFPKDALQARRSSVQKSSPLARASPRSSMDSTRTIDSVIARGPVSGNPGTLETHMGYAPSVSARNQWELSSVMTTGIEPVTAIPSPLVPKAEMTISPVMIVANVESGISALPPGDIPPTPPHRSVFRPKPLKIIPQGRQKSSPITICRNPVTGAIERTGPADPKQNRRSLINMPTPPLSPDVVMWPRRMSMPPQVQPPTPWESDFLRQPEEKQAVCSATTIPEKKMRSMALRERVLREKLRKDKEISDIVAKTVDASKAQNKKENGQKRSDTDRRAPDGIERQLRRLERNNGAWLQAMKPLLENMARTLDDMRADGRCPSLRMSEFMIDMEAEAKRLSQMSFAGVDGTAKGSVTEKKVGRGRSPTNIARLRLDLDNPTKTEPTTENPIQTDPPNSTLAVPQPVSPKPPRTPQEHEQEAEAAIRRRIQQQEAMVDNLLGRWGMPPSRPRATSDAASTSSTVTARAAHDASDDDDKRSKKSFASSARRTRASGDYSEFSDLDPMIGEIQTWGRKMVDAAPGRKDEQEDRELNPLMSELRFASRVSDEDE